MRSNFCGFLGSEISLRVPINSSLKDFRGPTLQALDDFLCTFEAKYPNLLYVHDSDLYDVATRGRFKATHGWVSVDVKMRHPSEAPNKFTVLSTVLCPGASTIPFRLSLIITIIMMSCKKTGNLP